MVLSFFDGPFGNVFECLNYTSHFFIVLKEMGFTNVQSILGKYVLMRKWIACPWERFVNNYRNELLDVGKIC